MSNFGGFDDEEARGGSFAAGPLPHAVEDSGDTIQEVATAIKTPGPVFDAFLKELDLNPEDELDLIGFVGEEALLGAVAGLAIGDAPASTGQKAHATRLFRECLKRAVQRGAPLPGLSLQPQKPAPAQVVAVPAEQKPKEDELHVKDWCDILDRGTFVPLSADEWRDFKKKYVQATGRPPAQEQCPVEEQVGALRCKILRGRAPHVDFALFGPYGRRAAKHRHFDALVYEAGEWKMRELRGPPNLDVWQGNWAVFSTAMIMLNQASVGSLAKYKEGLELLCRLHPQAWGVIYMADMAMRSEHWAYMMDELLDDPPAKFDKDIPWDTVIALSTFSVSGPAADWWYSHVTGPLTTGGAKEAESKIAQIERRASMSQSVGVAGGSHEMALMTNVGTTYHKPPPAHPQGGGGGGGQKKLCMEWNYGRCSKPCPYHMLHQCAKCGSSSHPAQLCNEGKGKGKGKSKGKQQQKSNGNQSSGKISAGDPFGPRSKRARRD